MQTNAPATTVVTPRQSGFNRFMARYLESPFGVLSGAVVLVRYTGRKSGEVHRLPVNAARYEAGYLIRVGHPEQKKWWRNFKEPWAIELVKGLRVTRGTAVAVPGSTERGRKIAEDYFAGRHGAAKRAGLPRYWKGEPVTPEQMSAAAATLTFVFVTPD